MKKYPTVITKCPICSEDLHVTRLSCHSCNTNIEGHFSFSKFNYLDAEKLYFIEVFVKNRGNIKAIEKELNISYPTVKKMLDEAVLSLGYKLEDGEEETFEETNEEPKNIRSAVLAALEAGEISVEAALATIKKIKGGK